MGSFWFLSVLIVPLAIFPLLSSSNQLNSQTSTSPAFQTNSPPLSSFQELSPDIAPLLPSPGGVMPSPAVPSIPTIPSSPSPPNPDALDAVGPDSAFSPLGSLPVSSAAPQNFINLAVSVGFIAYWSMSAA